jgi:hypothetical protein
MVVMVVAVGIVARLYRGICIPSAAVAVAIDVASSSADFADCNPPLPVPLTACCQCILAKFLVVNANHSSYRSGISCIVHIRFKIIAVL